MTTEVVRDLADNIIGDGALEAEENHNNQSAETVIREQNSNPNQFEATSSYVVSINNSVFSRDVDHWIRGDAGPLNSTAQRNRTSTAQRSTVPPTASLDTTRMWYFAALILPFVSLNNNLLWRCTPSTVIGTAELLLTQVVRLCATARSHVRRIAREQTARDLFATIIDILLVIYALGFLVLSMYQASLIG